MNRLTVHLALPTLAVLAVVTTAWVQVTQPAGPQVTVSGTVVDFACRFNKGLTGPTHVPCAQMCAKAGVAFGILTTDGKLYIPAKHGESSNPALLPFVEEQVTVTGQVSAAGGAYTIEVATIAKKG